MTIEIGQRLPAGKLKEANEFDAENGCPINPQELDLEAVTADKKIVIFGVPGAFTPLCSAQHLPGYVELADKLKAAGADEIWCIAVNDVYVMAEWGKTHNAAGKVRMMADGSAELTKALGLDRDLTAGGMGIRCFRFGMIVDNGVVTYLGVEGSGEFGVSKAETLLEQL